MNSAFGRFVALALLITGALLPVLGQTTHQPFLQDVAALAEAQAATAALAAAQAEAQACAQAAATSATSVEVVPTIEASIQTFIDPQ